MIDYRIGDRVRYHKRHDYNGDATLNGVVGTVSSTTCSPGHIEVTWDEGKYAPKFPFVENVEPFPYPIPTPTPDERAVAPELVARLVELARSVATSPACTIAQTVEAQNILAALEPVDPMLLEARKIVADQYGEGGNVAHLREQALSGEGDEWFHTKVALAALRRGRALASRDVTPCTREQFEDACRA